MEEKNNGLIVAAKTFFKKVKEFFLNLFKKEEIKTEEVKEEVKEEVTVGEVPVIEIKKKEEQKEETADDKEEFFKKYELFKAEKLDVSELSGSELVKMNAMLEEEMKMNKNKLNEALNEFNKKKSEESNNQ